MTETNTVILCSFQKRAVYDEILKNGQYQLTRATYEANTQHISEYTPYRRLEKYERLMTHSGLHFPFGTLPIWAWYKDEFANGIHHVSRERYAGVLQRQRQAAGDQMPEIVGLLLEIPKSEIHLTNLYHWDAFLFSEIHDDQDFANWTQEQQGWFLADLAEAENHFSQLHETHGAVRVQAIFPVIRRDMIRDVLFENESSASTKNKPE